MISALPDLTGASQMLTLAQRLPSLIRLLGLGWLFASATASAQLVSTPYGNDIGLTTYTTNTATLPQPPALDANQITYTVQMVNNGPGTVTAADRVGVRIFYSTLNLNEFSSVPGNPPWACGVVDPGAGSGITVPSTTPPTHAYKRCIYTGPDLPPGAAFPILTLTTQTTGPGPSYTSTACVGAFQDPFATPGDGVLLRADPNAANDCQSAAVVDPGQTVDLAIAKRAITGAAPVLGTALPAAAASVAVGADFNWVIDLVNNGPGEALSSDRTGSSPASGLGVVVTDTLPSAVTVTGPISWAKAGASATAGAVVTGTGTCAAPVGTTVTCNLGDMANGGTARIVIPVRFAAFPSGSTGSVSDPQVNNATVTTQRPDSVSANNTAPSSVTVSRALISGTVYIDDNTTGGIAGNPLRITGVTLELRTGGTSCSDGTVLGSTQTAADGTYAFPGGTVTAGQVTAGTAYRICQIQPTAFTDGSTNPGAGNTSAAPNAITIAALPVGGSADNNFGERRPPSSISGLVYIDRARAGVLGSNPGRIPGVTVELRTGATSCTTGTVLGTTVTAADGRYAFPGGTVTASQVVAGLGYLVCEIQPAAYLDGVTNPPTGNTSPAANAIAIATLAAGGSIDNNFGELAGRIAGFVYQDYGTVTAGNRDNGLKDSGELGILNVPVTLTNTGTGATVVATTAVDGGYAFEDLPAGTYAVTEGVIPAASGIYTQGRTSPGTISATTVGTAGVDTITAIALPAGGEGLNYNFGELPGPATISGLVYIDPARTGVLGGNTGRVPGVTLELRSGATSCTTGTVLGTTVTGADGSYAFPGGSVAASSVLAGSDYLVCQTQPTGFTNGATNPGTGNSTPAPDAIRIPALPATGSTANNFGEFPPPFIAGLVYIDQARTGVLSPSNTGRIAGVTLELRTGGTSCTTGTVLGSTQTAADGSYRFPGGTVTQAQVTTGTAYRICQTQPGAFGDGTTNPGTGNTSPVANSILIAALPDVGSPENNFGEIPIGPDLVVTKAIAAAPLTETGTGRYTITVRNGGAVATSGTITVTDTLPAGLTAVASTTAAPNPSGSGWSCAVAGQTLTCTTSEVIAAGATSPNPITLNVNVGSNVCPGGVYPCNLVNRVSVAGGGEQPTQAPTPDELANPPLCSATATQNSCRIETPVQQPGGVSGLAWFDGNVDRVFSGGGADVRLPGIVVELLRDGNVIRTTTTNAQGEYLITGLIPGPGYEIRFRDAVTGGYYGRPVSADPAGGNDPSARGSTGVVAGGTIRNITIPGGNAVRLNQNLPLDPSGVVYDSQTREPVGGAVVEFLGPTGALVPAQCVIGGVNRMTTGATGSGTAVPGGYGFWLITPAPAGCPGDANYQLRVTPPIGYFNAGIASNGTANGTSQVIAAQPGVLAIPGGCAAGTGTSSGLPCTVQVQPTAPAIGQPTPYYFTLPVAPNTPANFVDIVNNHIPVDPIVGGRFVITKQAGRSVAEVGDIVPYTITVRSLQGPALPNTVVTDRLPAGFRYVGGTFRIGGLIQTDPSGVPAPTLRFPIGTVPAGGTVTFTYALRVGVGAQQGDGINRAQATSTSGATSQSSNVAQARVRITGGVFSNETCVVGKVYVDCNHNQIQDPEELGIPGVRVVLQDGTGRISDSEGKYSFCGLPPRTHVLKIDRLTVPRGSRLVTSSNRNVGDAHSIFIDAKNGELQRADFIEGSCSNTVLEQVKSRRMQGEVRAPETEKRGGPALKFEGRPATAPQQATDSANQTIVKPREPSPNPSAPVTPSNNDQNVPVPQLPAASPATQRPTPPPAPGTGPGTSR